jgi:S1-C subfamily serine protease
MDPWSGLAVPHSQNRGTDARAGLLCLLLCNAVFSACVPRSPETPRKSSSVLSASPSAAGSVSAPVSSVDSKKIQSLTARERAQLCDALRTNRAKLGLTNTQTQAGKVRWQREAEASTKRLAELWKKYVGAEPTPTSIVASYAESEYVKPLQEAACSDPTVLDHRSSQNPAQVSASVPKEQFVDHTYLVLSQPSEQCHRTLDALRIERSHATLMQGSGFFVKVASGIFFVTNAHVVPYSTKALIRSTVEASPPLRAHVVYANDALDFAILNASSLPLAGDEPPSTSQASNSSMPELQGANLRTLSLASGELAVESEVFVSGYNVEGGEVRHRVTNGKVIQPLVPFNGQSLIQHSAPVVHGNSGGPLLNISGQVVGMNRILIDHEKVGVKLPSDAIAGPISLSIPKEIIQSEIDTVHFGLRASVRNVCLQFVEEMASPRRHELFSAHYYEAGLATPALKAEVLKNPSTSCNVIRNATLLRATERLAELGTTPDASEVCLDVPEAPAELSVQFALTMTGGKRATFTLIRERGHYRIAALTQAL